MNFFFKNKFGIKEEVIPIRFSDKPGFIISKALDGKQFDIHSSCIETVYDGKDQEEQTTKLLNTLIDNGA